MNQLTDYISVVNIIPEDICDSIISSLKDNPNWTQHQWTGTDTVDNSKELDVLYNYRLSTFNPMIAQCLRIYAESHGNVCETWSSVRLNKYGVGQKMAWHTDLIRQKPTDGIPVLSCVGLLNDDYIGGDFIMFKDTKIDIAKGDIMIFPSTFLYPHMVTEVTEGTRYSFVTWIY